MTNFQNSKVLKLTLEYTLSGEVRAQWYKDPKAAVGDDQASHDKPWIYLLDEELLLDAAKDVDQALKNLIALDWGARLPETPHPDYTAPMRALARAGMRLRQALMTGKLGNNKMARVTADFSEWFERTVAQSEPDEWRIEIVCLKNPQRTIPWGLCFDLPPDTDLDDLDVTNPEHFRGFWCQGYGLAVRGKDLSIKKMDLKRTGSLRILTVQEMPDGGKSQMEESTPRNDLGFEKHEDANLIDDPVEYSKRVREAVSQHDDDIYLYLSLKSDVDPDDRNALSVPEVRRFRSNEDNSHLMLVVLDGDAVIRGDRGKIWLDEIMAMGQNGLIATEVDIRNKQLLFLGWEVLSYILNSGITIIDAINEYRREHWPLGLIYGVYCNPIYVFVDPPKKEKITAIGNILRERRNAAV